MGQNGDIFSLRDKVLNKFPTLNDITVYQSIIVPATGYIESNNIKYIPSSEAESNNEFAYIDDFDPPFPNRLIRMYSQYDSDFLPVINILMNGELFSKMSGFVNTMAEYYIGK